MPQTTASTGRLRVGSVWRADEPRAMKHSSPRPAPTASTQTSSSPVGFPSAPAGRHSRSLKPVSPASLTVETTLPVTRTRSIATPALDF